MGFALDALDRALLNELQLDATLPLKVLAERVGSSVATCQRRIRALTEAGVILRQVALVSPEAVGRPISVYVMVKLDNQHAACQDNFERRMRAENDVMGCYEISGDYDFLLLVHAADMPTYHAFTRRVLTADYHVKTFNSLFVMNFAKAESRIVL
ncbi:MAG: Lrp/AsnC family transcriptional regulator [Lautropia sp.]|nr:Lrp/AsnC family transcriptional regulator [Lautropia sp.]